MNGEELESRVSDRAKNRMRNPPLRLVVFSDDWGRHPSSCQHLIRRLLLIHLDRPLRGPAGPLAVITAVPIGQANVRRRLVYECWDAKARIFEQWLRWSGRGGA